MQLEVIKGTVLGLWDTKAFNYANNGGRLLSRMNPEHVAKREYLMG